MSYIRHYSFVFSIALLLHHYNESSEFSQFLIFSTHESQLYVKVDDMNHYLFLISTEPATYPSIRKELSVTVPAGGSFYEYIVI